MKNDFLKITKIIKEAVNLVKREEKKEIENIFKKALIKIRQEEDVCYPPNGPRVTGLTHSHNHGDWSY